MPRRQLSGDRVVIAESNRIGIGCEGECCGGGGLCCPPDAAPGGFAEPFDNPWDSAPYVIALGNPGAFEYEPDNERIKLTADASIVRNHLSQNGGTGRSGYIEFRIDELDLTGAGASELVFSDCRMFISDYDNCDPLDQNVVTDLFIRIIHDGDIFDFSTAGQGSNIVHTSGIGGVGTYRLESDLLPGPPARRRLRYYVNGELIDELEFDDDQTQRAWCRGDPSITFLALGNPGTLMAWYDDWSAGLTPP